MSYDYATPGVYIDEITNPGVISGVTTSVTAFVGPAARGPLLTPTRVWSFDEFVRKFGTDIGGGRYWPHLSGTDSRVFSLGYSVQGFFENGGGQAVIVRVGTAKNKRWHVLNGVPNELFQIEATAEGAAANGLTVIISSFSRTEDLPSGDRPVIATGQAGVESCAGQKVYLSTSVSCFCVGDVVTFFGGAGGATPNDVARTKITAISDSAGKTVLTVADIVQSPSIADLQIRIADMDAAQTVFRLGKVCAAISPGSILEIFGTDATTRSGLGIVQRTDNLGFVFLRHSIEYVAGEDSVSLSQPAAGGSPPRVRSVEFTIDVRNSSNTTLELQTGLSLDQQHPGCVFRTAFASVLIHLPVVVPPAMKLAQSVPASVTSGADDAGIDDRPGDIDSVDYGKAFDALGDVDDVSIVCAPDAVGQGDALAIQVAMIEHCMGLKNRIALLDVPPGSDTSGARDHAGAVQRNGGYAALFHPALRVTQPVLPGTTRPSTPNIIAIPASGHMAGVMARMDEGHGVHYPPANTDVRGVIGLDQILSDRQQGFLNPAGVNVLRIFPGEGQVTVWGARTTAPPDESDWTYINVRRLLIYIERSIQRGIRWAVFKPNDYTLWQGLKRTISDFLERIWKSGGLVGKTREQAFRVRIDEQLNTPTTIALGQLHIEVLVAPVRPAEFIVVHIGLWDGGATVTES